MTKTISGYEFKFVEEIKPKLENGKVKSYNYKDEEGILEKFRDMQFCDFKVSGLTGASGVYVLFTNDKIAYIGCAENLAVRWGNSNYAHIAPANCKKGGQPANVRVNNHIYVTTDKDHTNSLYVYETEDYKAVESKLLQENETILNKKKR